MLNRLISCLPTGAQDELRRWHYRRHIWTGRFHSPEVDFPLLPELVKSGDTAIDIGANVGHYTRKLSQLVGTQGRVIALEPIPRTFALLAANCADLENVTLLNLAASSSFQPIRMTVPKSDSGLENFYQAHLSPEGACAVLAIALDILQLNALSFIKIDAEGHDVEALRGAEGLIKIHSPTILVEGWPKSEVSHWLSARGYSIRQLPGSHNVIGTPIPLKL
jgi:FkbM family methyltransferase